uniref:SLOG family protein n=1 Tax=Alistipes sp. TaxID=1872444 RepID=UPI004057949C
MTACFTGHRTYDGSCNAELVAAIRCLYTQGYRTFLCGMAVGFDLIAAECALSLRDELKGLKVVAVIPFDGMQKSFKQPQRELFERIAERADESVIIASHYSKSVYMMRNNYLVDNSSATIAYFTGRRSGTSYTIRRAEKSLSYIINIYNNPQQELFK